ncbi:hypothetical protein NMY22_g16590 [Coprinellus aureogranulatus]|nr:hypothetical protein NMY22_g16590 [Coprinellus aureogranulatus]
MDSRVDFPNQDIRRVQRASTNVHPIPRPFNTVHTQASQASSPPSSQATPHSHTAPYQTHNTPHHQQHASLYPYAYPSSSAIAQREAPLRRAKVPRSPQSYPQTPLSIAVLRHYALHTRHYPLPLDWKRPQSHPQPPTPSSQTPTPTILRIKLTKPCPQKPPPLLQPHTTPSLPLPDPLAELNQAHLDLYKALNPSDTNFTPTIQFMQTGHTETCTSSTPHIYHPDGTVCDKRNYVPGVGTAYPSVDPVWHYCPGPTSCGHGSHLDVERLYAGASAQENGHGGGRNGGDGSVNRQRD